MYKVMFELPGGEIAEITFSETTYSKRAAETVFAALQDYAEKHNSKTPEMFATSTERVAAVVTHETEGQ